MLRPIKDDFELIVKHLPQNNDACMHGDSIGVQGIG